MKEEYKDKTKEQLINEVVRLRQRIAELEKVEAERKKAEEELKQKTEQQEVLLSSIPAFVYYKDIESNLIAANKAFAEMLNVPIDQLAGKDAYALFPKEQAKKFHNDDKKVMSSGRPTMNIEEKFTDAEGKTRWASTSKVPSFDEKGKVTGMVGFTFDITERKQAEEALRESEERFRTFMETASDLMNITDKDGNYTYVNDSMARTLGYSKEELIGMHITQSLTKESLEKDFKPNWGKFLTNGEISLETNFLTKKGKEICCELKAIAVYDSDGNYVGSKGVHRDITERKQLEAELLVKNEVFEASISANSTSDNEGILTYVNSAFIKIFGYENKEEAIGKPISDFLKFEDKAMNIITALNETGEWEGEYTGLRKDKTTFAAYGLATIIKDRSGDTIGYQSAVMDISDRKRMEEILKESEEKYSSVVENSMDGIIVLQKGIIKFLNPALLDLSGYNLEELIDKEFETLLSPEYRKLVMDRYQARLAGKDVPSMYEVEIIRKDGISVPIEVNSTIITYGDEEATLSFIRNITERKQAEDSLWESGEKIRSITASAHDAIIMVDNEETISFWNDAAERIFGYTAEEIIGKQLHETIVPERFHEAALTGFKSFRETGQGAAVGKTLELAANRKDGTEFPVELSLSAVKLKGKWTGIGIIRDITELKKKTEAMKRFNKLAVGRELMMIELKKEINALLEDLGKEPRYKIVGE